jgi:hypothetical protein
MNVPKFKSEKLLLFIAGAVVWLSLVYIVFTIVLDLLGRFIRWLATVP